MLQTYQISQISGLVTTGRDWQLIAKVYLARILDFSYLELKTVTNRTDG